MKKISFREEKKCGETDKSTVDKGRVCYIIIMYKYA